MTDIPMTTPAATRGVLDPRWLAGRGRLAQSIRLEEKGPDRLARVAIGILVATIAGFVLWAAVTEVGEIAPASGEVTPVGLVKRIQHLEGGIMSAINVREGDLVDEGEVLLELESGTASPELEQLRTRFAALELQLAQLQAIGNSDTPRIEARNGRFSHLAAAQETLLRSKREALERQEAVLRQQGQQRRAELDSQIAQEKGVAAQVTAIEEQIRIRTATFEKGYTSRVVLLEQQRELARINTQLAELQGQAIRSREAIAEVDARIAELRARNQLDATQEIGKVTNDLAEIVSIWPSIPPKRV